MSTRPIASKAFAMPIDAPTAMMSIALAPRTRRRRTRTRDGRRIVAEVGAHDLRITHDIARRSHGDDTSRLEGVHPLRHAHEQRHVVLDEDERTAEPVS